MLSRKAKMLINIPNSMTLEYNGKLLVASGALGKLEYKVDNAITLDIANNAVRILIDDSVVNSNDSSLVKDIKMKSGTLYAIINNMIVGVTTGFEKTLVLNGVGYKASIQDNLLTLSLGYSHPIQYAPPANITLIANSPTEITVKGLSKHLVGEVADKIKKFRSVEPYKGKGIRYKNEVVVIKETAKKK